jgi:uncharacterized protein
MVSLVLIFCDLIRECIQSVIVLHFNHHGNLQAWLESEVRRDWIGYAKSLLQGSEDVQVLTGLETWFKLPKRP